ncbi:MAG TPA: hypothetical protein VFB26_10565 [Gaiellaceae bacterium]|nr:hypothetical protein [Gaiellaceae bacterium]
MSGGIAGHDEGAPREHADTSGVSWAERPRERSARLLVHLTEPRLLTDLQAFLIGMLRTRVADRNTHLEIEVAAGDDPVAEQRRAERFAKAWQANGHVNVRTEVELVSDAA